MRRMEGGGLVAINCKNKKKKKRETHNVGKRMKKTLNMHSERGKDDSLRQRLLIFCVYQNYLENLLNMQGSDQQRL